MKDFFAKFTARGVALGVVGTLLLGFWFFGWTTGGSAEKMAVDSAKLATVAALTPYCVEKAKADPDPAKMAEYLAASVSNRTGIVEKAGWATSLGSDKPNRDVARACATALAPAT